MTVFDLTTSPDRACANCAHCNKITGGWTCNVMMGRTNGYDPVTGYKSIETQPQSCRQMRSMFGTCNLQGVLFTPLEKSAQA